MQLLRLLVKLLARISPVSRYVVDGPSMEPAYHAGDRLVVNRLAYRWRPPAIGDVVIVRDPEQEGRLLIKRIALAPDGSHPGPSHVWVTGDNLVESRDSRVFGPLSRRNILGKAWFRY